MTDVKFSIVLPYNSDESIRLTKLAIRGSLLPDPQEFSINFVNSLNCTDNLTYHLKVKVPTQTIVENYKLNGEWSNSHREKYLNIFDEFSFSLEFQFDYDNSTINVYQVWGQGHNFVTKFETLFALSEIQSTQVWGDVRKIEAFELSYD
ncbi:uncharacterized protein LOC108604821 [Drosophila busckii]|uniref:uncharacterized protein LOC108604821 n=1 Tax=Drosophila busckii TaxID=30019 RepID=UPI00083F454E|nr:uncharacterized protein LOC108604821 [Drosophila busckii]